MRKFMLHKIFYVMLLNILVLMGVTACKSQDASADIYSITISGEVEESGVISYMGYEMNVYRDISSNPCGDCADQPVSVYVGADAQEVAQALAEAVTRANDIWHVKEINGGIIVFEKSSDSKSDSFSPPSAPAGLIIEGEYN